MSSIGIPSDSGKFFSHEAIQKEQDPGISSKNWFGSAVLSCRQESRSMRNRLSTTLVEIRPAVDSEVTIPKNRIDEIVQGIVARKNRGSEGRDSLQVRIDQLTSFLLQLLDPRTTAQDLDDSFKKLNQEDQRTLLGFVHGAQQSTLGNSGARQLNEDPRIFLRVLDDQENNCIEYLIETLHRARSASLSAAGIKPSFSSSAGHPTFKVNSDESYLQRQFSSQKTLYGQIAEAYVEHLLQLNTSIPMYDDDSDDPSICNALVAQAINNIPDPQLKMEIVGLCAQRNPDFLFRYIKNFGIEPASARIELAKRCATESALNARVVFQNIKNLEIGSESAEVELAEFCIMQNPLLISSAPTFTSKIRFEDMKIRLIKFCAVQDPQATIQLIPKLGVSEDGKIEIVKFCAMQDARGTAIYIHRLRINDPENQFKIALSCVIQDGLDSPQEVDTLFAHLQFSEDQMDSLKKCCVSNMVLKGTLSAEGEAYFRQHVCTDLQKRVSQNGPGSLATFFHNIVGKGLSLDKAAMKKLSMLQIAFSLLPNNIQLSEDIQKTITGIIEYRSSQLSMAMLRTFCEEVALQKRGTYTQLITKSDTQIMDHFRLPMITIAKWKSQCQGTDPSVDAAIANIKTFAGTLKRNFKDKLNGPLQMWLLTAQALDQQPLSPERKIKLLSQMFLNLDKKQPVEDLKNRLSYIQAFCSMGNWQFLDCDFLGEGITKTLSEAFFATFEKDPYVNLTEVAECRNKYLGTFAQMRVPNAWKIYEMQIQCTRDPNVQAAFERFMINVLNGMHREQRYAANTPHIAKIMENHGDVWERWKAEDAGREIRIGGSSSSAAASSQTGPAGDPFEIVDTDHWEDLFLCGTEVRGSCQRVDGNPSLNKCLLAYVMDGKNRMLAIKDPVTGKIMARCMFRLLWDPIRGRPVLFQDRLYPSPCLPAFKEALDSYAKERAVLMQCPLYTMDERPDTQLTEDELVSLGSPAPFEYEDASDGVMPRGEFSIHAPRLVRPKLVSPGLP